MKSKQAQKLIETLASSGAEELAAIDEQIATLETELESFVAEKRQGIEALKRLRAVLDIQVNGKQPKVKKSKMAKRGGGYNRSAGPTVRERIYDYLGKQDHPVKPALLAVAVGCSVPSVYAAIDHQWFTKTSEGIEIARAA